MTIKKCADCNQEKPPDEFYKDPSVKSGRQRRCMDCAKQLYKRNYQQRKARREKEESTLPVATKFLLRG